MKANDVVAPVSILLARELSSAAKVLLLTLNADADMEENLLSPKRMSLRTGMSTSTVNKALKQLTASGWYAPPSFGSNPTAIRPIPFPQVILPGDLLADDTVPSLAKVVYGLLLASPGYEHPKGTFSCASLSNQLQLSVNTIASSVRRLAEAGWIVVDESKLHDESVAFSVSTPAEVPGATDLAQVRRRLESGRIDGKALMWEYLSLIIDSLDYADDAGMCYLMNPYTQEQMTFDRYYFRPIVVFEFNTPRFHWERFYLNGSITQEEGDRLLKRGICALRGVPRIEIDPEDLNLEAMQKKAGDLLPRRNLKDSGPVIKYLEAKSRSYLKSLEPYYREQRELEKKRKQRDI